MAQIKDSPTIHSFIQDLLWYQMTSIKVTKRCKKHEPIITLNILLGIGGFTLFRTIDVIIHSPLRENQHVRHFNFLDFPTLIFIISLALFFVLLSSSHMSLPCFPIGT